MKVKEFCKKHEKKLKAAGFVALGAGAVGGVVFLRKKYLESSKTVFLTYPIPLKNGEVAFEAGMYTSLGKRIVTTGIQFSADEFMDFAVAVKNVMKEKGRDE